MHIKNTHYLQLSEQISITNMEKEKSPWTLKHETIHYLLASSSLLLLTLGYLFPITVSNIAPLPGSVGEAEGQFLEHHWQGKYVLSVLNATEGLCETHHKTLRKETQEGSLWKEMLSRRCFWTNRTCTSDSITGKSSFRTCGAKYQVLILRKQGVERKDEEGEEKRPYALAR